MTWSMYATPLTASDISVGFTVPRNIILRGIRIRLLANNNPTYTSMTSEISSRNLDTHPAGTIPPYSPIAVSSTSYTKAQFQTLPNAMKDIYFEFPEVSLAADVPYIFYLRLTGYTFSDASHLAWLLAWPDPIPQDVVVTRERLSLATYYMYFIGAEF